MTNERVPFDQHLHSKWMEGCVEPQHSRARGLPEFEALFPK
jgi:hypothetical protein